MSSPTPLLCALVLLVLPFPLDAQGTPAATPAPAPAYGTLLKLLKDRNLVNAIAAQLKNGLTIFAPTDNAFNNLPNGTLESLSTEVQTQLLLLHVVGKYYSKDKLSTAGNPVRTLATNYTLNFTSGNNQVNVSTGAVNIPVNNELYVKSPLAIFSIDSVLIPPELAGGKAPPPSTPAEGPTSGSCRGRRIAWGVLLGAGVAFLGLLR
ncbi:unnamed protein product [Spirodela intermedia]|uniref:FAS1 domain-containing protein n=1 Tax=Spirodela intermedia TaxID=51605 RepID=A0A7I8JT68_SPIIN|nr:unnamed protein product [Spirodela intermedia]CAA6672965.1 unnamed protein product [Spirodela intermedia]